ncbi:multiple cyclophane-containing RiPP AmcA [Nocardiopsis quinghaiensis]|uniref:multiple cyclophane-containing RiPP AmcA n=1 Tax=Nocardiopsis quinghaiensis TaxID=464995 RepID=UPI00167FF95B|nr:multiple cyclophane-containing RiPP AmcA [Nocardiopsis quinghaiensis]
MNSVMSALERSPEVADLIGRLRPSIPVGRFDNRDTWDNKNGGPWDNRSTWDNWSK